MPVIPKVSITIPTYNRAHLICESLESVFAQTYTDYEIIVVDDGSTDNTEEVLAPYMNRIRYIKQENAGVSAARNHGIFEAKGEYIAFLDSDDLWFPEKLEKQMLFFEEHPNCSMLCHAYLQGLTLDDAHNPHSNRITLRLMFEDFYLKGNQVGTSSVIIKKNILRKTGIFDSTLCTGEDFDLWIRIAYDFECWYLEEALSFYRYYPENTMGDPLKRIDGAAVREMQALRWRSDSSASRQFQINAGLYYIDVAYALQEKRLFPEAAMCFFCAIKYSPRFFQKLYFFQRFLLVRYFPFIFRLRDFFRRKKP